MHEMIKPTGMLICYSERAEMDKVHARLKDLKLKESCMKDAALATAYNPADGIPYPWTLALIVSDAAKLKSLDDWLTDSKIDLGEGMEIYGGEPRIRDFFGMLPLGGKYEPGIIKIKTGTCPMNGKNPMSCMFCPTGHLLECHWPNDCATANCSHLSKDEGF